MTALTVWALTVPVEGPARWQRIPADLGTYQNLVGGNVEAVTIEDATIFCNEDARRLHPDQPNTLLTQIMATRHPDLPGRVLIHGPAIILGKPRDGWETSAPAAYGTHDGQTPKPTP